MKIWLFGFAPLLLFTSCEKKLTHFGIDFTLEVTIQSTFGQAVLFCSYTPLRATNSEAEFASVLLGLFVRNHNFTCVDQLKTTIDMKKILILGAASMLFFASCRKNRVCVCTYNDGSTATDIIPLSTKSDAEAICDSYESPGYSSCELN